MKLFFQDFTIGFLHYFTAFRFMKSNKLMRYFLIPGVINMLIFGLIIGFAYFKSDNISDYLLEQMSLDSTNYWIHYSATIILFIVIILLGFLLYRTITYAILSPFMSKLSEKVEGIIKNEAVSDPNTYLESLQRGISFSVSVLFKELIIIIPLLLVSWIPIVGQIAMVIIFIVSAFYLGYSNYDFIMERHFSVKEGKKFIKKNKALALGNGVAFSCLLFIPIFGFFIAPVLSTVSASILGLEKIEEYKAIEH